MAGPPARNSNARKNSENRVIFSTRLPPKAKEFIKNEAKLLDISQSDLVVLALKVYAKWQK